MRLLDTREQKSPRFLIDAFPDMKMKSEADLSNLSLEDLCAKFIELVNEGHLILAEIYYEQMKEWLK